MNKREFPILEYDNDRSAKIEPSRVFATRDPLPRRCVLTFYQTSVIEPLCERGKLRQVDCIRGDTGRQNLYVLLAFD